MITLFDFRFEFEEISVIPQKNIPSNQRCREATSNKRKLRFGDTRDIVGDLVDSLTFKGQFGKKTKGVLYCPKGFEKRVLQDNLANSTLFVSILNYTLQCTVSNLKTVGSLGYSRRQPKAIINI